MKLLDALSSISLRWRRPLIITKNFMERFSIEIVRCLISKDSCRLQQITLTLDELPEESI